MLDSTYLTASNPNTMCDTGNTRNCEYTAKIEPASPFDKGAKRDNYERYLVPNNHSNKTFYSFGGKKSIKTERHGHEMVSLQLLPNEEVQRRTRQSVYPKLRNELVNDYTKNISNFIFSPGVAVKEMAPELQTAHKRAQSASFEVRKRSDKKI